MLFSVWSTVGSTNMDYWSFLNDDEVNAIILNREFAGEMEKMFARDLAESYQIQWEDWKKRPLLTRTSEWYDLTSRYRKRLFDLDKKDYITFKTKEHMNQVTLQKSIGRGLE